jgi:hypothetical protein
VPNQRTSVRIMSEALCEGYNNVLLPAIASRVGQYDFGLACARSAPEQHKGTEGASADRAIETWIRNRSPVLLSLPADRGTR